MLSWKKMAKYTLASGLALGLVFSTGVRAMAAEEVDAAKEVINYNMDYHHNVLRITVLKEEDVPAAKKKDDLFAHGEPKYVYVGVGKTETAIKAYDRFEVKCEVTDDSKPADGDTPAVPATKYSYDYYVEVDLPTYVSPTVKYIVKAYSSNQAVADAKTYTIATQTRKLEVKYLPKTVALEVKADSKVLEAADYEIKTLYGDWVDSTEVDAEKYESYAVYGATLVVREKATDSKPASKEVKVKIPKKANGPKATINPTKLTVTIPNNAFWRIIGDTPRSDAKANTDDKYIWTATAADNEGWIKNSEKKAQALTELQKKITEAGATIETATLKVNPNYDAKVDDKTQDEYGQYLDKDGNGTNDPEKAAKENAAIDLFDEGAVLELKTEATDKKAESKVSFFEIPVQSEAVKLGTDFTVSYDLNNAKTAVSRMKVKNESSGTLEVALVNSGYDITKVTFTKLASSATKPYNASAAAEGKILLVRTASVVANAKKNVEMVLGGKVAEYVVAYPKKAEALSGVTLTRDADATVAGKAILAVGSPDATKAYAYKIGTEEVTADSLGLGYVLPDEVLTSTIAPDPDDQSVTTPVSGLEADKYITVYEYDAATKIVSKMVSHKILAGEISKAQTSSVITPTLEDKITITNNGADVAVSLAVSDTGKSYKVIKVKQSISELQEGLTEIPSEKIAQDATAASLTEENGAYVISNFSGVSADDIICVYEENNSKIVAYGCKVVPANDGITP